jgi:hypothetical protein
LVITLRKSYKFIISMILLLCAHFIHLILHPCSDKRKVQLPEPFSIYPKLFFHCFTPSVLFNISCPLISVVSPISKSHQSLTTTFTGVVIRRTYIYWSRDQENLYLLESWSGELIFTGVVIRTTYIYCYSSDWYNYSQNM